MPLDFNIIKGQPTNINATINAPQRPGLAEAFLDSFNKQQDRVIDIAKFKSEMDFRKETTGRQLDLAERKQDFTEGPLFTEAKRSSRFQEGIQAGRLDVAQQNVGLRERGLDQADRLFGLRERQFEESTRQFNIGAEQADRGLDIQEFNAKVGLFGEQRKAKSDQDFRDIMQKANKIGGSDILARAQYLLQSNNPRAVEIGAKQIDAATKVRTMFNKMSSEKREVEISATGSSLKDIISNKNTTNQEKAEEANEYVRRYISPDFSPERPDEGIDIMGIAAKFGFDAARSALTDVQEAVRTGQVK